MSKKAESENIDISGNENIDSSGNEYPGWTSEHKKILYMVCKKTGISEGAAYNELMKHNGDYKKIIEIYKIRSMIDMVVKQTNYTPEEAYEKLTQYKGDITAIIREYMGTVIKPIENKQSVNQKIFSEIRGFMDKAVDGYNKRKERTEYFEKMKRGDIQKE